MNVATYNKLKDSLPTFRDVPSGMSLYEFMTEEQRVLDRELSCIDMLNSIFTYHSISSAYEAFYGRTFYRDSYAKRFIEELGEERVRELFDEQKEYFQNEVIVHRSVYVDSEGGVYNSFEEKKAGALI